MKLLLFGAGKRIQYVINSIENTSYTTVGLIDNNKSLRGSEVCGLTVCGPEDIANFEFDCIIITSDIYFNEISEELISKWNIDKNKIKRSTYIILLRLLELYKCNPDKVILDIIKDFDDISDSSLANDLNAIKCDETNISLFDVCADETEKQFAHNIVKERKTIGKSKLFKVILWGAGNNLGKVLSCLKVNNVDILGVIDSNATMWGRRAEGEIEVYSPQLLQSVGYDYLIITAKHDRSIINSCAEIDVPVNKIISFWKDIGIDQDIQDNIIKLDKRQNYINEQLIQLYEKRVINAPYEYGPYRGPEIIEAREFLSSIVEHGYSLTRFGDGEYEMLLGNKRPWFQAPNPRMKEMLREIIKSNEPGLQVAHADNWGNLEKYTEEAADGIRAYVYNRREALLPVLMDNREHGDAYCTRPWIMYQNVNYASEMFDLWKKVWCDRKVVIVEGEFSRIGLENDLLSTATSVKRIICPHKNAFDIYDTILVAVEKYVQKDELVLVSLGPTATCLVYDLYKKGYQSVDIGQIDSEYEWFLIRATERVAVSNKLVAEANGDRFDSGAVQSNNIYQKQILWKFKL